MPSHLALGAALGVLASAASADLFTTQFLPLGVEPEDIATVDLDGDGLGDLVASAPLAGQVVVALARPGGLFVPAPPVVVAGQPTAVALGDLDGDRHVDLVLLDAAGGTLVVALGRGDGTFAAPTSTSVADSPRDVVLTDVDGDGVLDALVVADDFVHSVCWLEGAGDGSFGAPQTVAGGLSARAAVAVDVDGDGTVDVAVVDTTSDTVQLLLGTGSDLATRGAALPVGDAPGAIAALDVDGDDDVDLVTANSGSGDLSLLANLGDGTFAPAVAVPVGAFPTAVETGDVTGDGIDDVVVTLGSDGAVVVLSADGAGGLEPVATYGTGPVPRAVAIGDVDGDLFADVVTADAFGNGATVAVSTAGPWVDIGSSTVGPLESAPLAGAGLPAPGEPVRFRASTIPVGAPGILVLGARRVDVESGAVVIVPSSDFVLPVVGGQPIPLLWPTASPSGIEVFAQAFYAVGGQVVATNALRSVVQFP